MPRRRKRLFVVACFILISIALFGSLLKRSFGNIEFTQFELMPHSEFDEILTEKLKRSAENVKKAEPKEKLNYNVHIFYYPWFGAPKFDAGSYVHWNHKYLPHWDKEKAKKDIFNGKSHNPPDDLASNFYPMLGAYSSRDPAVIRQHMAWIADCGVGVLVVTWYPPSLADENGRRLDNLMPKILDEAAQFNLKVVFHLEPYKNRSAESVKNDVQYILSTYAFHPAFYYYEGDGKLGKILRKPIFYVYDSYLIPYAEWATILKPQDDGAAIGAYFLGLLVKKEDEQGLVAGGFDGFYTYFGAESFSYGSTQSKWAGLTDYGRKNFLISSISVAPGYIDERVRRWNSATTKQRRGGQYFNDAWQMAMSSRPDIISITSFNEWHEGTQIEPCVPKSTASFTYLDYTPEEPEFYLNLTRNLVREFKK